MLIGHDRREVVEYRRLRKLLTLIHNVNVGKNHQKAEHQIMPLPGDESRLHADMLNTFAKMEKVQNGEIIREAR